MSSTKAKKRSPTSSSSIKITGSVPKAAPKYMAGFFAYVVSTFQGDVKKQEKVQTCDRVVHNMFKEHWAGFQEYAATMRPAKKQRTEQPYNESKLSKDTKAIETKLQTMDEHLPNLNQDEILEHIQSLYFLTKQMYRKVRNASEPETTEKTTDVVPGDIVLPVLNLTSLPHSSSVSENTVVQNTTTTQPSTSDPSPAPAQLPLPSSVAMDVV